MKIVSKYIISYYDLLEQKVDHLADSMPEFLFFLIFFVRLFISLSFHLLYILPIYLLFFLINEFEIKTELISLL